VVSIRTKGEVEKMQNKSKPLFLGFFEEGSEEETAFRKAADQLRDDELAQFALAVERNSADGEIAFASYQMMAPSVAILRNDNFDKADRIVKIELGKQLDIGQVESVIKEVLQAHSFPPVTALRLKGSGAGATKKWNAIGDSIDSSVVKYKVVLVVEEDDETLSTHVPTLKALAAKHSPGSVLCGYYAYNAPSSSRIASALKVEHAKAILRAQLPVLVVLDMTTGDKFVGQLLGSLKPETIESYFERAIANDGVLPYVKSEPVPTDNDDPLWTVKTIVGSTFRSGWIYTIRILTVLTALTIPPIPPIPPILITLHYRSVVLDGPQEVLLEAYAPWCGHCKKLTPVYEKLGRLFAGEKRVMIAKVDATLNELPSRLKIRGFPTLIWFSAPASTMKSMEKSMEESMGESTGESKGGKDIKVYKGGRDIKSMAQFIQAESRHKDLEVCYL
jgi:thiol-disulfide isomerase/thioredoxin